MMLTLKEPVGRTTAGLRVQLSCMDERPARVGVWQAFEIYMMFDPITVNRSPQPCGESTPNTTTCCRQFETETKSVGIVTKIVQFCQSWMGT